MDGLPPALLSVTVEPERILLVAHGDASVRGARLRPGQPCWLLPGESVVLGRRGQVRLALRGPLEELSTRSLVRRLLASARLPTAIAVPRLLCIAGRDLGRVLLLRPGRLELGRSPACDLRLEDGTVSRRHARVTVEEGQVLLEDLGTPGGTRINGRRLPGEARLLPGDVVGVGRTLLAHAAPASRADGRPRCREPRRGPRLTAALALGSLLAGAALAALHAPRVRTAQERSGASPARSTSSSTSRR
ncbi:MAG TPA: FHA domain-containing protein [Myxococcaceae bacterium]|nr:FHA domain-containing protein [Myxococcaceae bacterium]